MDIKFNNIDELNASIKITLVGEDYQANVDKSLKEYQRKITMPGFRQGKVPMGLVKRNYEKPIKAEEINKVLSKALFEYLKDNKVDYMGEPLPSLTEQPTGSFDKDTEFSFTFDIALAPKFEIAVDNNLKLNYYNISVNNEDIEKAIEGYKNSSGTNEPAEISSEKSLLKGEVYQVDENGERIAEGIGNKTSMLVEHVKNADEKAKFIGKKVGDKICFDLKQVFPSENEAKAVLNNNMIDFNTINANFAFAIEEISEFVKTDLTQESYDRFFGKDRVHNEEEMRAEITAQYQKHYAEEADYKLYIDARESLVESAKVNVPMDFMKRWLLTLEQYKDYTKERLESEFPAMEKDMKWNLIENKLANDNKIEVSADDELEQAKKMIIAEMARYGVTEYSFPTEMLDNFAKERLAKDQERRMVRGAVINAKITKLIKEKASLENKDITYSDFVKLFEK
ncbi:MAG: trigger factor [Bacteroidales bacterium]|nr:trigger factor [Bacteroidales bacterium]